MSAINKQIIQKVSLLKEGKQHSFMTKEKKGEKAITNGQRKTEKELKKNKKQERKASTINR